MLVLPARVQGEGSAAEVAAAIRLANQLQPELDVLVVARGGGSSEDLWSFNDEAVVRAMAAARMPVVSAIGHEIDVTLADLVADVRALTPSEAAERVVPSARDLQEALLGLQNRLTAGLTWRANLARRRFEQLQQRLPFRRPFDRVQQLQQQLDQWQASATNQLRHRLQLARQVLAAHAAQLEALSPLQTLSRGYSLTTDAATGKLITDQQQVVAGQLLRTQLHVGEVVSRVEI